MADLNKTNALRFEVMQLQQELSQHLLIAEDFRNTKKVDELEELIAGKELEIKELYYGAPGS